MKGVNSRCGIHSRRSDIRLKPFPGKFKGYFPGKRPPGGAAWIVHDFRPITERIHRSTRTATINRSASGDRWKRITNVCVWFCDADSVGEKQQ